MNSAGTITQAVAGLVSDAMDEAGVSQLRLADESGIPRPTLIRRLKGQSPFKVDELEAIASVLGCSVTSLIPKEVA